MHRRARERGPAAHVYWPARLILEPLARAVFRPVGYGRANVPARGPLIVAANHRSFLDPFILAGLFRRPIHIVTKEELFAWRPVAWVLSRLGAFPVRRGAADEEMLATARAILARGGIVLMFPEGTRTRPGRLGEPRTGVGHLALAAGAPVLPVAIAGTEAVRRGWRIRPHRITVNCGPVLPATPGAAVTEAAAAAHTAEIWASVRRLWAALGREP